MIPSPPMLKRNPVFAWAHRLRHAFDSKRKFLEYIHTENNADTRHSWTNEDLKPSPLHMVNWRWYNFCLFWFGMGFGNWYISVIPTDLKNIYSPTSRTLGSSIVGAGLSWWQATIVVWIAASVSGLCMALNSRAAANYHVGYPVILRTSFGMYGHYWPVLARGAAAMLWVSVLSQSRSSTLSPLVLIHMGFVPQIFRAELSCRPCFAVL